ncbi:putative nuclease HARBI1 [Tachysurus ichikawai]
MESIVHRYHHLGRRGYLQRVYVERAQPLEQYTVEELISRLPRPSTSFFLAPEPVEEPDQPLAFCPNEGLTGRIVRDAIVRHYF